MLQSKKEIAKALRVLTKEENFPVLVHCMHGKDRTGLLIMLILLLCDIEPQVPAPLPCPLLPRPLVTMLKERTSKHQRSVHHMSVHVYSNFSQCNGTMP